MSRDEIVAFPHGPRGNPIVSERQSQMSGKPVTRLAREAEFLAACRALMGKHGLHDWKLEIDDYEEPHKGINGAGAYCSSSKKLINPGYIDLLLLGSDRARRNDYLHEIAHALVFLSTAI